MIPLTGANRLEEPPRWLWLWAPVLFLILERAAFVKDYTWFDWFYTEAGMVELLTPIFSTLGAIFGIAILRHRPPLPRKLLRVWVALLIAVCIYATGEEISWGQNIFHWKTPAAWAAINAYGETDFSGLLIPWAEEIPRMCLSWFALAGIIRVLLRRGVENGGWFWPTRICLPAAFLAILVRVPETLGQFVDLSDLHRGDFEELEELYLAWFLFLYPLSVWYRLRSKGGDPLASGFDLGYASTTAP